MVEQVLEQLLLLSFDPGMATAARMQQCLAVFFKAYAAQSALAHRHLSAAALPAARKALSFGPLLPKSAAPQLLKFVSTLLQASSIPLHSAAVQQLCDCYIIELANF
jgi:hypothetical protein